MREDSCTWAPRRPLLVLLLVASLGCSHQTVWLGDPPPAKPQLSTPLPITVGVIVRSFEATRVRERVVLQRVAEGVREAGFFQGVMHPLPPGARPLWELQLLVRDAATEPNSNFWKGAVGSLLPIVWLQNDYTLELEALLTRRGEVIGTYTGSGAIRHHYQVYADRNKVSSEGLSTVFDGALRELLASLHADAERLNAEDRARSGR